MKQWRKRKKYQDHEQEPLASIAPRSLQILGADAEKFETYAWQEKLLDCWKSIVGQPIASHTKPHKIKDGKLTILIDSPAWNQELQTFGKKILLESIQKVFPKVRVLRFQVGDLDGP